MEQPLVSVVTITRNRGKLIGRCIKSVLGQTYHNIKHIVVDGASEDETDDVVASFNDTRIKYIKLAENWPIAKTINYGIELATGKYITFLDSDDEYLPSKIEKQLQLIESLPEEYGMVYCWMTEYDNETGTQLTSRNNTVRGFVGNEIAAKNILSGTSTFFFRADVIKQLGGWKDKEEIGIVSDWELATRVCQKWKVDYIPESLVKVYVNHGTIRMSEDRYYQNEILQRIVKFNKYYLSEFQSVFEINPGLAKWHYYDIIRSLFKMQRYKEGFHYYSLLLKLNPEIYMVIKPLIGIIIKK